MKMSSFRMAPRGRPTFKPTAAQRQQVEQLMSCSMSQESIARVLGISRETLSKHFAAEIEFGAQRKRAEVIGMLFRSAKSGNVTAQKKLEDMTKLSVAEAAFQEEEPAALPGAPKVGKKEQAAQAASTAGQGTDWGEDLGGEHGGRIN